MENVKIDWEKAEYDYVFNGISQRDLAKKYGVSSRSVQIHCKDGKWVDKRKEHNKSVSAKLRQLSEESLYRNIDRAISVLSKDLGILDHMADMADSLIYTTQSPGRDIDSKVSAAIKIVEELRKLAGVLDPRDEARLKLEREKFEFDKQKIAAEQQADKEIRIVLEGDLDQWAE